MCKNANFMIYYYKLRNCNGGGDGGGVGGSVVCGANDSISSFVIFELLKA